MYTVKSGIIRHMWILYDQWWNLYSQSWNLYSQRWSAYSYALYSHRNRWNSYRNGWNPYSHKCNLTSHKWNMYIDRWNDEGLWLFGLHATVRICNIYSKKDAKHTSEHSSAFLSNICLSRRLWLTEVHWHSQPETDKSPIQRNKTGTVWFPYVPHRPTNPRTGIGPAQLSRTRPNSRCVITFFASHTRQRPMASFIKLGTINKRWIIQI